MRIGLIHPGSPEHGTGGAERHWQALTDRLAERGHDTELRVVEFPERTLREVLDGYRRFGALDVSDYDLVITGKYPAWMVDHDNHLLYLIHRLRGLYDTYPTVRGELGDTAAGDAMRARLAPLAGRPDELIEATLGLLDEVDPDDPVVAYPGPLARWVVRHLDDAAFARPGVRFLAANAEETASRAGYFPPERTVMVSRPETNLPRREATVPPLRSRFFTTSRHDRPKRIDLVIRAFALIDDPTAVLRVGGDGPMRAELEALAAGDPRVELLGYLSEEQLAAEYAAATAVVFTPDREDFGLISLEAMRAGTPVVTTTDSGGAKELIEHGVSGMIVDPTPDRVAWAMRHIAENPQVRWELALNARRSAASVDWTPLLDEIDELGRPVARPHVLALSTYAIDPMIGGGQRRVRHLLRSLARWADVTVLVSSAHVDGIRRRRIEPGIDQVEVGRTDAQTKAEDDLYFALGRVPADDVIAARITDATPAFAEELARQLETADVVVGAQPFLLPLVGDVDVPIVHDSQNVEARLKAGLFERHGDLGRWLAGQTSAVEAAATRRSSLVVACTAADLEGLLADAGHPDVATAVVDNGVDTDALPRRSAEHVAPARAEVLAAVGRPDTEDRPLGVFIGSWHPPNVEAARLVFDVARRRPDWVFVLAGSHTSEFAGEDLPENVSLIAVFAESLLWPLMAGADVALNPMVSGGGSNLKVYDYLAVGVPVLTTEVGARGLGDAQDVVRVVEQTAGALATGLDDARSLPADRLSAGRMLVEERFDWSRLGERWAREVLALVDGELPPERPVTRRTSSPALATAPPPPSDPVEATMELVGAAARRGEPTPLDSRIDPAVREHLKFAREHRFVGQHLPVDARMRAAKSLVVRVGRALSNEQVHYNESVLEAVESMAEQLHAAQLELLELRAEVASLRADRRSDAGGDS